MSQLQLWEALRRFSRETTPEPGMGLERKAHWENIYSTKGETGVSWYQSEPRLSLELIGAVAPAEGGRIIDVGGGASVLVERLLDLPFGEVAVLDISETALGKAKSRLGGRAERVEWIAADVTEIGNLGTFDVWHDRAGLTHQVRKLL